MAKGLGGTTRRAMVVAALASWTPPALAAEAPALPRFRHRFPAAYAATIEPVVLGASERLARPECGRLLGEFTDRRGRQLAQRLAELGFGREAYLGLVVFVDGGNHRSCQHASVMAVTSPGSRVVALCPAFRRVVHHDPGLAEGVVIHEALHTLGLEENPPSPHEINRRIFDLCGR